MAADEVFVELNEGTLPEELDGLLESTDWVRGEFFKGENSWAVRIPEHSPLSIPKAIAWLEAREAIVAEAGPRPITWK
jgi:hypothetical protein